MNQPIIAQINIFQAQFNVLSLARRKKFSKCSQEQSNERSPWARSYSIRQSSTYLLLISTN